MPLCTYKAQHAYIYIIYIYRERERERERETERFYGSRDLFRACWVPNLPEQGRWQELRRTLQRLVARRAGSGRGLVGYRCAKLAGSLLVPVPVPLTTRTILFVSSDHEPSHRSSREPTNMMVLVVEGRLIPCTLCWLHWLHLGHSRRSSDCQVPYVIRAYW